MRRLLFVPLVLLGFACAVALGSNDARTAKNSSVAGTISALSSTSITVHSVFNVTCKVTRHSPKLDGYAVGDQVKIRCEHGVLTHVKNAASSAHTPNSSTPATSSNTEHAPGTTASGVGTISAISTSSSTITVTGDRSITCAIGASSPSLAGYHVGDHAKIGCINGVLYAISRTNSEPPATTTGATTTASNAYGFGTISALSSTGIGVTGDRNLTCTIGASSPRLGDYHVGDHVKIGCQNGLLIGIVRSDATTTTTTPVSYSSATGTLTTLSSSSITVTGDGAPLSCPIGPGAQSLTEFHLGDKVRMDCLSGAFYKLIKTDTITTPPPTTTRPTTTPVPYTYATGTLTALSSSSITVTGDGAPLTCPIGPSAQSLTEFHVGDKVRMYCQGGIFYKLIKTDTTTTTTTTAPPTTPTPPVTPSYGTGTITTLSTDRITVTGDAVLSCTLSATSPSVTAYHVGDKVKMYCQSGALYALIKS